MEVVKLIFIACMVLVSCSKPNTCHYESDLVQSDNMAPTEFNQSGESVIWYRDSIGSYTGVSECEFSAVIMSKVLPKDDSISAYIHNGKIRINTYRWDKDNGGYKLSDGVLDNRITCN
jgi:hypothetical protein